MTVPKRRTPFTRDLETDVLVVGGGLAGCMASLRARQRGARVVLVDKSKVSRSGCSSFNAGIFNTFFPHTDDLSMWMREVVTSGDYLSDQEWVRIQAERTFPIVEQIDAWARERAQHVFEKQDNGDYVRRLSRGHVNSRHCVVNALPMMAVLRRVSTRLGVEVVDRLMITDLLLDERTGRAAGAVGFDYWSGDLVLLRARTTVLAAGGCGFKSIFMGHRNLTGDLQGAAFRAGVVFQSMEQAESNTCDRTRDIHGLNLLVSAGGRFLNRHDEEFMWRYNPQLGNRAVLSELTLAFCREVKEDRGPIRLDVTGASLSDQALLRKILPETFRAWTRDGVDPFTQHIEWVPAFYGTLAISGGIAIDHHCATNIPGLYAAGDASAVPPQGAGLGGIPLAFAAVSGEVAGEAAAEEARSIGDEHRERRLAKEAGALVELFMAPFKRHGGPRPDDVIHEIQKTIISLPVCYLKERSTLEAARTRLQEVVALAGEVRAIDLHDLVKANEVRGMLAVAALFLEASLAREESRGFHFREDFPFTNNRDWLKWVFNQKESDGIRTWTKDIPTPFVQPEREIETPPGIAKVAV